MKKNEEHEDKMKGNEENCKFLMYLNDLHDHGGVFHDSAAWSELLNGAWGVQRSRSPEIKRVIKRWVQQRERCLS